jgi:hypothetical protein
LNGSKRVPWRGWSGAITDLGTLKSGGAGEALAIANNVADVRRIVGWTEHTYKLGEATNIDTTPRRPTMWRGWFLTKPTCASSMLRPTEWVLDRKK